VSDLAVRPRLRPVPELVAARQRERLVCVRGAALARERASFTNRRRIQKRIKPAGPVLLDLHHWCLHIDGDYLGLDRYAKESRVRRQ